MNSSQIIEKDIILAVYKAEQSVFRLTDIAMMTGENDFSRLNKKLNYYSRTGKLGNPRKGIYTKPGYTPEELACKIFTPSYISLRYVLQKAGIVFQYDTSITLVSYLSRKVEVENKSFVYRKIKGYALVDTLGINRQENHVNIASPERAFLDLLYLEKDCYFDNLSPLNKELVFNLLPLYRSEALNRRARKLLKNV